MLEVLNRKVRQMHAALGTLGTTDLSTIRPEVQQTPTYVYTKVDFNSRANDIALANSASLLIANIASIKDHLKVWCRHKSIPFHGDTLIRNNKSVALVHDLWNVDKHAELSSPPRSGHKPKLQNLRQAMVLTTGPEASAGVFFSMDPRTGKVTTGTSGSGSVQLKLTAQIVNETGTVLADFVTTCEEAAEAWRKELITAGVPLK